MTLMIEPWEDWKTAKKKKKGNQDMTYSSLPIGYWR
jgi:hypothetical protein